MVDCLVQDQRQLGYVFGVFYVGPTARWEDRLRSGYTDPIPVRRIADAPWNDQLFSLPVYDHHGDDAPQLSASPSARWLTAILWCAAAAGCLRRWPGQPAPGYVLPARDRGWLVLASFQLYVNCRQQSHLSAPWVETSH